MKVWTGSAVILLASVVGGATSSALAMNESGLIAGIAVNGGANTRAFIYDQSNGSITIILPAYQSITYPLALNNNGQVVGYTNGFEVMPFLYSQGSVTYLPSFGGIGGSANGINNIGQVVGYSDIAGGNGSVPHALLYANGVMTDLGTFGAGSSWADAIIDNGWIVGGTPYSNNAFLYANEGTAQVAAKICSKDAGQRTWARSSPPCPYGITEASLD